MSTEEFRVNPSAGPFVRNGFGAVLAEFGCVSVFIRTRPCAALAIETVDLIQLKKCPCSSRQTHATPHITQRLSDSFNARGARIGFTQPETFDFNRSLRPGNTSFRVQQR